MAFQTLVLIFFPFWGWGGGIPRNHLECHPPLVDAKCAPTFRAAPMPLVALVLYILSKFK
jgi:hypothetical protein